MLLASIGAEVFDRGGEKTTSLFSSIGSNSSFLRAVRVRFLVVDSVSESEPTSDFPEPLLFRIRLERRTEDGLL